MLSHSLVLIFEDLDVTSQPAYIYVYANFLCVRSPKSASVACIISISTWTFVNRPLTSATVTWFWGQLNCTVENGGQTMDFNTDCFVFCEGKKGTMEMKNYASLPCSVATRRNRAIEIYTSHPLSFAFLITGSTKIIPFH